MIIDLMLMEGSVKEHGSYSFEWREDLLILSLSGAFNDIAIRTFFKQVLASVVGSGRTRWVLLSRLDRKMIGTPAVFDIIKNAYRWGEENGCVGAAISGANVVVDRMFSEFFKGISYPTQLFDFEQDAIHWLNGVYENNLDTDLSVE